MARKRDRDHGVDWEIPIGWGRKTGVQRAWDRTIDSLPADAPRHCYEVAVQIARLTLREDRFAGDPPPAWDAAAWEKCLRDTIKLRADLLKQVAIEARQATPAQRGRIKPADPKQPTRAKGVASLVRGSKATVH